VAVAALTADPPIDPALAALLVADGIEAVKASDPRLRQLLIALGNAVRDAVHPDTWVRVVTERCLADPDKHWVITDVRYPNEAAAVRRMGGLLVKVERPGEAVASDAADDALAGFWGWDLVVTNDGTLDDLRATVARDLVPAVLGRARGPGAPRPERTVRSGSGGGGLSTRSRPPSMCGRRTETERPVAAGEGTEWSQAAGSDVGMERVQSLLHEPPRRSANSLVARA